MFKKYFTNYQSPSEMYKTGETEGERNEDQVYSNKLKETIKNVSEDRKFIIEENKKINIVEHILYFNQLEQQV